MDHQAEHALTPHKCDKCGAEMKLLGRLPRRLNQPPRTVYRCMNCDNVTQD